MTAFWPNGARLALSVVVNVEEGAEMRVSDGDKAPEPVDELGVTLKRPIRVHGNESNYLYGIKAGAPRIMKLLDDHQITATFTAAALALERAPELAAAIAAGGHEVCSHGWRWVHQFHMDEATERDFIEKATRSIEQTTGQRPVGWLSRYLLTENTRRLLLEAGYTYHMDDYSDDQPFWETADGDLDASPKGDAPGFVHVIDDVTLAIPDRPGNRRADGAYNIVASGRIGLLFMIPGMNETLRVNGRASMTTDPALLEQLVAQGKPPVAACRVAIEEVFLHCAKALVRSKLWDSDRHMDRAEFPPLGHMIAEQIGADDRDGAEAMVQDSLRNKLY